MKKQLLLILSISFFILLPSFAQCEGEADFTEALAKMDDGQYIRDFTAEFNTTDGLPGDTLNYAIILNGRCQYKFSLLYTSFEPGEVTMELYDGHRLVASNVGGGKVYDALGYICKSTKIYRLVLFPTNNTSGCARVILALQKQFPGEERGF